MPDNGPRIAAEIRNLQSSDNNLKIYESESLTDAVKLSREITPAGGVVLLSPGAPSYGRFKNFSERGDFFTKEAGF